MSFEIGDVVKRKDGEQKMTVLRFVGAEENDAMNLMDNQLEAKGFQAGAPMCEWFVGTQINTATFHLRDLELAASPVAEDQKEPDETEDEAASTEEEDLDFDDEDFDF